MILMKFMLYMSSDTKTEYRRPEAGDLPVIVIRVVFLTGSFCYFFSLFLLLEKNASNSVKFICEAFVESDI